MEISLRDKQEFCYRFRFQLEQLPENWYPHPKGMYKVSVKWIAAIARVELGYSKKTADIDIVYTLHRVYNNLIPNGKTYVK